MQLIANKQRYIYVGERNLDVKLIAKKTNNQTKQPWEVDLWMEIEQISGKLIVQALEWEWAASEKRDTQYISL